MLKLALRNVLRHRARSGTTLAAIVTGVTALVLSGGFVQDMFAQLAEVIVHSQYGHLQLARTGYFREGSRRPNEFLMTDAEVLKARVTKLAGVESAMARVHFSGLLNNGRTDLAVIGEGIEPGPETKLGSSMKIVEGRTLVAEDRYRVLLGEGVARGLRLGPGSVVTLVANTPEGAMNTMDLTVAGVFRSFSKDYDARVIRISLPAAQELLQTTGANTIVVSLEATAETDRARAAATAAFAPNDIEVRSWRELSDFYDKAVALYERQFGALRLIVLFMVLLSVANSVNMSAFERRSEFGTMRALGNRSRSIAALLLTEAAVLALVGATAGLILGALLGLVISAVGIPMPPPPYSEQAYQARISLVPSVLLAAFAIGVVATLLAAVLPALRVSRLGIVDALRSGV